MVDVAVICGSAWTVLLRRAFTVLKEHGVSYDYRVIPAHRDPEKPDEHEGRTPSSSIAGLSAALPGVIASKTGRPVIGVPVSGKLMGFDALLSIVQMPKGVPVACVGVWITARTRRSLAI